MAKKVRLLQPFEGHKKGEVIEVSNNIAHSLIEEEKAELAPSVYRSFRMDKRDRMMRPTPGRNIREK